MAASGGGLGVEEIEVEVSSHILYDGVTRNEK